MKRLMMLAMVAISLTGCVGGVEYIKIRSPFVAGVRGVGAPPAEPAVPGVAVYQPAPIVETPLSILPLPLVVPYYLGYGGGGYHHHHHGGRWGGGTPVQVCDSRWGCRTELR